MAGTPPSSDPAFFQELFDSISYGTDGTNATAERVFRVPALEVAACFYPGVPAIGSEHPRATDLLCDSVKCVERYDQVASRVEALYSTDGRFRKIPGRPPADLLRGYLRISNERADLSIPFFVATRRSVPKYSSDPTTGRKILTDIGTSWEWTPHPLKIKNYRVMIARSITLTSYGLAEINNIRLQMGQIHKFPDGSEWMFNVPEVDQLSPTRWKVNYQWESEWTVPVPGTPPRPGEPPVPADSTIVPLVLSNYYVTATEPRPAFYAYQVIPGAIFSSIPDGTSGGSDVDVSIPQVRVFDRFPDRRNNAQNPLGQGWNSLPGNPLNEYI